MKTVTSITELRQHVIKWKKAGNKVAFVPTMGNLHQGHLSLITKAREIADKVVVSIFVNPLQFDDKADLSAYPRTLEADIQQLESSQCDLLFTPTADVMYPQGMEIQTIVTVPNMDDKLCGQNRPGHFDGVATVVLKLFNMVQADIAVFGEKDYQQLLLIKRMVKDLDLPITIVGAQTCREESGLAMSSRNQYLTEQQRQQAAGFYQTLSSVKQQIERGEQNFLALQQHAKSSLLELGFTPDYVDIRRADSLELATKNDKSLRILAAAQLGQARLIDNIACNLD
ncbi:MAG: pantoate--beta-alanine ligase [Proteobacteria bacterium]|nr:pantoate--beta-alanine ligase [Pseudomonadota bacterium]